MSDTILRRSGPDVDPSRVKRFTWNDGVVVFERGVRESVVWEYGAGSGDSAWCRGDAKILEWMPGCEPSLRPVEARDIDWARFVPREASPRLGAEYRKAIMSSPAGTIIACWDSGGSVRRINGDFTAELLAGQGGYCASTAVVIRHADGRWADGYGPDGPIAAAREGRELAPGWKRNSDDFRKCLECIAGRRFNDRPIAAYLLDDDPEASTYARMVCDACAEPAGVFASPPDRIRAGLLKDAFPQATGVIVTPKPAPSACVGKSHAILGGGQACDGVPVLRIVARDLPPRPLCDECYLANEKAIAKGDDGPPFVSTFTADAPPRTPVRAIRSIYVTDNWRDPDWIPGTEVG